VPLVAMIAIFLVVIFFLKYDFGLRQLTYFFFM